MDVALNFIFSAFGPVVALCIVAVWLLRLRAPGGRALRRFAMAAAVYYLLASLSIVPYGISRWLAAGYRQLRPDRVTAGTIAIVVLGGGDRLVQGWTDRLTVTTPVEAERVLEAARVFRMLSPAWIISSGGEPDPTSHGEPSATTMRDELVRLGVPPGRILLESRSRNTHEEAVLIAPMLKRLGVEHTILVTSSTHMRRSLGAFRAVGVDAIPAVAPGWDPPSRWEDRLPSGEGLDNSATVAHEIGGIVYYWLRGWWRR